VQPISTPNAPAAIGPYSQAVVHAGVVYCSGQIALHPGTGLIVGESVAEQTDRVLRNLVEVLAAAGSGLPHVLKTTVYLRDMADFGAMNEVYAKHFGYLLLCKPYSIMLTLHFHLCLVVSGFINYYFSFVFLFLNLIFSWGFLNHWL